MTFVSAGPSHGRIRLGDELRDRFARRTPGGRIQRIEILPAGSARPGNALPVNLTSNSALFVGVSRNQAGIEHKGGSGDQPFRNAALHHCLKRFAQQGAIAELPILGESRVVRAPRRRGRADRTSGRPSSGAPPRTTAVQNECHNNNQPAASVPKAASLRGSAGKR
jgi:hypothetical protein